MSDLNYDIPNLINVLDRTKAVEYFVKNYQTNIEPKLKLIDASQNYFANIRSSDINKFTNQQFANSSTSLQNNLDYLLEVNPKIFQEFNFSLERPYVYEFNLLQNVNLLDISNQNFFDNFFFDSTDFSVDTELKSLIAGNLNTPYTFRIINFLNALNSLLASSDNSQYKIYGYYNANSKAQYNFVNFNEIVDKTNIKKN